MKTIAVLQSNYIPWKGYFDLINDVDQFIFYDDVQFTKNDWRNRNKIKTPQGPSWTSIPVGSSSNRLIHEVRIENHSWQAKHWKSLQACYAKCPYFESYRGFLDDVYLGRQWDNLSKLNQHLIQTIATEFLGMSTEFGDSREYELSGRKMDRLLELLTKAGAERYVSGPAAKSYVDPAQFDQAGIELVWKDYTGYPEYPQRHPPFDHYVSILDLLFNVGPDAPWFIWAWREGGDPPG